VGVANDVLINGVDIGPLAATTGAVDRGSQTAAAINAKTSQTGVTATFDTTSGVVSLAAVDGRNITVTATANGATATGLATATTTSQITLSSTSSAGITLAGTTGAAAIGLAAGTNAATATAGAGVSSLDLTTATGAQAALTTLDAAINTINNTRGSLGAYQNRFESTVASLQITTENLTASRGRITDTDFAKETANLSRSQVLQQAGTAMLAQANQSAQGVLALLR
jgi:flagellin